MNTIDTHINTHELSDPLYPVYPCEYEITPCPLQKKYPPRSFQGYEPLAYVRDILMLQRRTVTWLTGDPSPSAILQLIDCHGFIPLNASGEIPTKYYGMNTLWDTATINRKANTYNFYGKPVHLTQSESDPEKVNIEISQLRCASNLGTRDGETDGYVYMKPELINQCVTGYLPDLYTACEQKINFGDWQDRQNINVFNYMTSSLVFETIDYINFANSGTYFVIAIETPDMKYTVQSEIISGNIDNAILAGYNHFIKLAITDWTEDDGNTFKAKIHISADLNGLFKDENYPKLVKPTRFNLSIAHHNYNAIHFATYTKWDEWMDADNEIIKFIKKNIFTFHTQDYLYTTENLISAEKFWYELTDIQTFKTTGIDQIYSGLITFHIDNIHNLYNITSVDDKLSFNTNISDYQYELKDTDLSPDTSLYNASSNAFISWSKTMPITSGIYSPSTVLTAQFKLSNTSHTLISTVTLSFNDVINTLQHNKYSSNTVEEFYDNTKYQSTNFGERYRLIVAHEPDINNLDLQVLPGSGLVYSGIDHKTTSYIRQFTFNNNIINPVLIIKGISDLNKITIYYQISDNWENINNITLNTRSINNILYIQLQYALPQILLKFEANEFFGIITNIQFAAYEVNTSEDAINKLIFDMSIVKDILNI